MAVALIVVLAGAVRVGRAAENGDGTTPAAAAAVAEMSVTAPIAANALPVRSFLIMMGFLAGVGADGATRTAAWKAATMSFIPDSSAGVAGLCSACSTASSSSLPSGIGGCFTPSRSSQPFIPLQQSWARPVPPASASRDAGSRAPSSQSDP